MKQFTLKYTLFLLLILLTSCTTFFKKKTERVLARVEKEYLYESDLKGIIPAGTSAKDSLELTRNFIENWVRQKLMIHQAVSNLNKDQMDFTRQLEDYKNSLIIFAYENALVSQKLDTVIPDAEARNYYDANPQNFLLKENIIRLQYIKLPLNSSFFKQFKKLLTSDREEDRGQLEDLCTRGAIGYFLDDQRWLYFSEVAKQLPLRTDNPEEILKTNREVEIKDSVYQYLVRVKEVLLKETLAPFELEKQRIRDILLNKRKIELINKMQEDVYSKALQKNDFEIF